jgi:hypothetical protein
VINNLDERSFVLYDMIPVPALIRTAGACVVHARVVTRTLAMILITGRGLCKHHGDVVEY